jgi:nitrate reductase NapE component
MGVSGQAVVGTFCFLVWLGQKGFVAVDFLV